VKLLMRFTAIVCLVWALLLLGLKDQIMPAAQLSPLVRALVNGGGIAHLALAYVFWQAASDPIRNCGVIYAAIVLLGLKVANSLYGILVLLPASEAAMTLLDLVVSLALLVGVLEALPRTLKAKS
jgi:hypothetical protein